MAAGSPRGCSTGICLKALHQHIITPQNQPNLEEKYIGGALSEPLLLHLVKRRIISEMSGRKATDIVPQRTSRLHSTSNVLHFLLLLLIPLGAFCYLLHLHFSILSQSPLLSPDRLLLHRINFRARSEI